MRPIAASIALLTCSAAIAQQEPTPPVALEPRMASVFDHVRVAPDHGVVEIDAMVAIDCHHPETPDVYLEVIACGFDSREHESLVVTRAKPSQIHAAMLAAGFASGSPGSWLEDEPVAPTGSGVRVELIVPDWPDLPTDPREWIRSAVTGESMTEWEAGDAGPSRWVFAGSRLVRDPAADADDEDAAEVYKADATGQIVGLHTFGSEVVGWTRVLTPDATLLEPEWLADAGVVPPVRTPVVIRLSRVDEVPPQAGAAGVTDTGAPAPSSDRPRPEP